MNETVGLIYCAVFCVCIAALWRGGIKWQQKRRVVLFMRVRKIADALIFIVLVNLNKRAFEMGLNASFCVIIKRTRNSSCFCATKYCSRQIFILY